MLQPSLDCLPRNWIGTMSRMPSPESPLSGMPSAVKKASAPFRTESAWLPGVGGVLDGDVALRRRVLPVQVEDRHREADLVVHVGAAVAVHGDSASGCCPVWKRTTLPGAPMSSLPFTRRARRT